MTISHRTRTSMLLPRPVALGLAFLFLTAIDPTETAGGPFSDADARQSHARMIRELAQIADTAKRQHPYLGDARSRRFRSQLDALPAEAPDQVRAGLHFQLGMAELYLGREREAIAQLHRARDIGLANPDAAGSMSEASFRLGLAYLRLGETQNCCQRYTADACVFPIRPGGIHTMEEGSRGAVRYFTEALRSTPAHAPLHLGARWLLNIAYMTLGEHPDGVPETYLIPPSAFDSETEFPRFDNIATELGLDTFGNSGGAVADDFDGDGFLDLVVSTWHTSGQTRYFRNNGDGTFTERTAAAGLTGMLGGLNMVQADYDNDGDGDLLVLRGAWGGRGGRHPNSLLRNDGTGRFTDVTFAAGLGAVHYPTQTGAWADYDNDGDLDLFVGNESTKELNAPSQLFRNEGDGTFVDVAREAGVRNYRFAKAAVWGDYDGDRYPDLFISNLNGFNRLYRNQRDGTFVDVAPDLGLVGPKSSFPAWFWDYDNDGILDLMVFAYAAGIEHLAASHLGLPYEVELASLYRGDGGGGFTDVARDRNLVRPTTPMGSNFGDIDGDGFLDFYLGTGDVYYEDLMPNVLYLNQEGERFVDVTTASGFGNLRKGHGIVFADLDHDGDQDVFEQMGGAFPGDGFKDSLLENPGFGNRWVTVRLVGVQSNRSAIGARIRVEVEVDGSTRSLYKHVNSGGTFGGNPLRQTIGLGRAEAIKRLEVYWPTSGRLQLFEAVPLDSSVEIVEDDDALVLLDQPPFKLGYAP